MKVLFMHPAFPGQFGHLAAALARDSRHQIVFITQQTDGQVPGVTKIVYSEPKQNPSTHPFLERMERSVVHSYAAAEAARALKAKGFIPDVIYGYIGGWSNALFIKDIYPSTPLLSYFEWFIQKFGGEYNFDPDYPLNNNQEYAINCSNMPNWTALQACTRGVSPTQWQRSRFPREFQPKIEVIFDGVDTEFLKPNPETVYTVPDTRETFTANDEIVTYATRGMEPMRGFHQFMEAAALIQQRRPSCHILVAGTDHAWYSKAGDQKTHKDTALERLPFDRSRLHFLGWQNRDQFRKLLHVSTTHVYLTRPYVLSWSAVEAMGAGCLVVGSDTPPVREVIENNRTGLLADFFSPEDIAAKVCTALENQADMLPLRQAARSHICDNYSFPAVLPKQARLLMQTAITRG